MRSPDVAAFSWLVAARTCDLFQHILRSETSQHLPTSSADTYSHGSTGRCAIWLRKKKARRPTVNISAVLDIFGCGIGAMLLPFLSSDGLIFPGLQAFLSRLVSPVSSKSSYIPHPAKYPSPSLHRHHLSLILCNDCPYTIDCG